ncbi:MAG: hypothetical protein Q8O14_02810 [bacterium]|jgi:hypothetical protein|nr:hypothetical protein [bacterium]
MPLSLTLSPAQAAIHDGDDEAARHDQLEALLAHARRLSARHGQAGVFLEYEGVELLHPDGRVLAVVEADPWAPEQKELARRIFAAADGEDLVARPTVEAILDVERESAPADWRRAQPGLLLAERLGCWQAYASLCDQHRPAADDE